MKRQVEAHSRRSCREQAATRLAEWGMCIRYRRVSQGIKAQALCERVGVSLSTLRRAERGDATVAASTYLIALAELSILGELLQEPSEYLLRKPIADGRLSDTHYPRSRIRKWERRTVWL
ncbi:helix-turn-helix domain-containing protein [Castellaniella sp. WN]